MQSFAFYRVATCLGILVGCSAGGGGSPTLTDPTSGGSGGTLSVGGTGASGGTGGTLSVGGTAGTLTVDPGMGEPGQAPARTCELCEDLPVEPIITDGTPMTTPSQFTGTGSGAGPCIAEPADGALFPWNWLRPRIRWTGTSQVYEVRISTPRQKNTLVAYTSQAEYYVPREVWAGTTASQGLARNNYEEDITVTVRGASGGAVTGESSVKFRTAAVDAGGSMVYWANVKTQTQEDRTEGDAAGWLMGFSVGDEAVVEALRVRDVTTQSRSYAAEPKAVTCIGCHSSTPDGSAVGFTSFYPWIGAIAGITEENRGTLPDFVTPTGLTTTQQMWMGAWTFSPGQWNDTKKIGLASYGASALGWPDGGEQNETGKDGLLWMNLAATTPAVPAQAWEVRQNWTPMAEGSAFGLLPRTGDNRGALMPDFANDGRTIAYTSTATTQDGRIGEINDTDIYTVPFNDGKGGAAAPLPGAATVGTAEYYPNYSADDAFVAFNHIGNVMGIKVASPQGFDNHLYYRPESEIWITPTDASVSAAAGETTDAGGIRLKANDADACNTLVGTRKGLANSWAKFSPRVNQIAGKTYYWLIFSSTRDTPESKRVSVGDPNYRPVDTLYSRLYMAAVVVEAGKVTTYPAVYLWNQDEASNNLTPAWDEFKIPAVPLPPDPR